MTFEISVPACCASTTPNCITITPNDAETTSTAMILQHSGPEVRSMARRTPTVTKAPPHGHTAPALFSLSTKHPLYDTARDLNRMLKRIMKFAGFGPTSAGLYALSLLYRAPLVVAIVLPAEQIGLATSPATNLPRTLARECKRQMRHVEKGRRPPLRFYVQSEPKPQMSCQVLDGLFEIDEKFDRAMTLGDEVCIED